MSLFKYFRDICIVTLTILCSNQSVYKNLLYKNMNSEL